MADEVFRQERKPVTRKEINQTPREISEAFPDEIHEVVEQTHAAPKPLRPEEPGFKVAGDQSTAQFILNSFGNNPEKPQDDGNFKIAEKSMMRNTAAQPQAKITSEPELRLTGSSKLEDLLAGIKDTTQVYEKIVLPSMGKFYDGEDGPIDGVLHIRRMTGEEEKILATPRWVKQGVAIDMIFNNCLKERYDSANFLLIDRTFLLIWLRGISYSPSYDVKITCPYTEKDFEHSIDLNLDVEQCPDNFNRNSLQGVLPQTGYKYRYRLATGADEKQVQAHRDKKIKLNVNNRNKSDDSLLYKTTLLIEDIEGLSSKEELQILLSKLPVGDVAHLRNVTSEPPFGVNTKVVVVSPYTDEEFEIDLPLEASFFFPKEKKTQV